MFRCLSALTLFLKCSRHEGTGFGIFDYCKYLHIQQFGPGRCGSVESGGVGGFVESEADAEVDAVPTPKHGDAFGWRSACGQELSDASRRAPGFDDQVVINFIAFHLQWNYFGRAFFAFPAG
jgi:hypothetical protein